MPYFYSKLHHNLNSPSFFLATYLASVQVWWVLSLSLLLSPRRPPTTKDLLNWLEGPSLTRTSHRHRRKLSWNQVTVSCCCWYSLFPCFFLLAVSQQRSAYWTDSGTFTNMGISSSSEETTEASSQSRLWWVLSLPLLLSPRHPPTMKDLLNWLGGPH